MNIIGQLANHYQREALLHHVFGDIGCKDVSPGSQNRPWTTLSKDRSNDIHLEGSIFVSSKKAHDDAIVNAMSSSKLFQPIKKEVPAAIFAKPNKICRSIILKQKIRRVFKERQTKTFTYFSMNIKELKEWVTSNIRRSEKSRHS